MPKPTPHTPHTPPTGGDGNEVRDAVSTVLSILGLLTFVIPVLPAAAVILAVWFGYDLVVSYVVVTSLTSVLLYPMAAAHARSQRPR